MIASVIALDNVILHALYAVRDPFLVQAFIWISELANVWTIIGFTGIAALLLGYRARWALGLGLMASVAGSVVITWALKELVARPRPSQDISAYIEPTYSFPSTHAALVVVLYGCIVWLLWNDLSPAWRKITASAVGALVLLEGFARLYLGVHYLSDVLAGYLVGAFFLWIGTRIAEKL